MSDKATKTKAGLFKMLAEAVRNTQPQRIEATENEPILDMQAEPKRKTHPRKARLILKATAKAYAPGQHPR